MGDHDRPAEAIPGIQDLLDQRESQVAAQKAADAQARTGRADTELTGLGAGTDPDFVRTEEHFEGMTLEAMYAAVHGGADGRGGLDAAGLRGLRQTLFDCYSELANASTFNLMGMNRIFGNGLWQGASGAAAQAASEQYSHVANQIGRVFESLSGRLDSLSWAAEAVRIAVPAPPTTVTVAPDPDNPGQSILPGLINPDYSDQLDTAQTQARQAAIQALNTVYKSTFPPAGTGVPTYATVPHIGGDQGQGAGNTNSSGTGTGTGTDGSTTTGNPPGTESGQPQDATTPTSTTPTGSTPASTTAAGTSPTGTGSTSAGPNTPSTTTTPTGVGNNPSLTTSGPGVRTGSPGGPGTSSRVGGPGYSVPATPSTPGATTPGGGASGTVAPGATRPAVGTSGAPGAGSRRKSGEDDGEHHAPDYLRGVAEDWTEGLGTPVDVIGANAPHDHDPFLRYQPTAPMPAGVTADTSLATASANAPATAPISAPVPASTEPTPRSSVDGPKLADADPDTDIEPTTSESSGFSGAGPGLDDLLAQYGWDVDASPDTDPNPGASAHDERSGSESGEPNSNNDR